MTFDDLEFKQHPTWPDGIRARHDFPSGYGVSVIQSRYSYGGDRGLYELAVMYEGELCYSTPITDDVIGYLTRTEVTTLLNRVANLPPRAEPVA